MVCASPVYLAARGVPLTPSDLASQNHECLVYSNRPASEQWRFRVDDTWKEAPVTARHLSVNNGDVLRDAAVAGLGLVVLPTFVVGEAVATGVPDKVRQRTALPDEIIDQQILPATLHLADKEGLICKPLKPAAKLSLVRRRAKNALDKTRAISWTIRG